MKKTTKIEFLNWRSIIKAIGRFIYWYLNPYWWIKPYFISFTEEAVLNPKYKDYIGGRLEIWTQWSKYDVDEDRFFTKKRKEFYKFRDKYNLKNVSWITLHRIRKYLKDNFNDYNNIKNKTYD